MTLRDCEYHKCPQDANPEDDVANVHYALIELQLFAQIDLFDWRFLAHFEILDLHYALHSKHHLTETNE